jgi:hypothetical protein
MNKAALGKIGRLGLLVAADVRIVLQKCFQS